MEVLLVFSAGPACRSNPSRAECYERKEDRTPSLSSEGFNEKFKGSPLKSWSTKMSHLGLRGNDAAANGISLAQDFWSRVA
jgi:hypothetical protein